MISVIVPTMWRGEYYKQMLPLLDKHSLVSEIFIIDNDFNKTDYDTINKLNKIIHHKPCENLYVNPSWNYGVAHCNADKICLYSDDVFFDITCLELVYEYLTPENGVIGFDQTSVFKNIDSVYFSEWESKNMTISNNMHHLFGICMFMHKNSYHPIPDNYKIFYGDTFLYNKNMQNGKFNWNINNFYAVTSMGSTSNSEEFKNIVLEENFHFYRK